MTPAKGTATDERAILSQLDHMVTAWNQHDIRAMSMLYAEDGDLINPFGRAAKSRTEIEALVRDEHSGPLKDSTLSLQHERIRFLAADVAVSDDTFEVSGARDPSGKEMKIQGHLTLVLQKRDGEWQAAVCRPMVPAPSPGGR